MGLTNSFPGAYQRFRKWADYSDWLLEIRWAMQVFKDVTLAAVAATTAQGSPVCEGKAATAVLCLAPDLA